ncbi:hypothetical protein IGJ91_001250 [Enterococcus sp. DIV0765f]|uniref:hypothetical protein n=1 Tax=Enterococcus sp. DIV0765f TaxID=2774783 RepID=UPI003F24EF54
MDYLDIIHRLEKITTTESAKQDLRLAYRGIRDEQVNHLPEEQAKERFIYYMRPYFIFQLYPRLYREKRWLGLTFDDYLKGINKALEKHGKGAIV